MSSQQLEDRYEQDKNQRIANALGLTIDELSELSYSEHTRSSNDGLTYGYFISFDKSVSPLILNKIAGLNDDLCVYLDRQTIEGEDELDPYED